ncbi:5-oxoprolinase subunit C family protein [Halalkalibacterium ligniniphilum]|uniref:5-oxoprolinase subunit C family protein n=1 Tax=Halalkalibacterium ligniniphilum TaxID=1134413 RepID=UPI00034DFF13|nr:hypothetical protein [Halalkalibacterium ligniniphilum]
MLYIEDAGFQTFVENLGRNGLYHLGVPPSGAADQYSFLLGNILMGHPENYAALEMTLLGPKIEVRKKTVIAITGAPIEALLNGKPIPMWETLLVNEGDQLVFKTISAGVKSYLFVAGGIKNIRDSQHTVNKSLYESNLFNKFQVRAKDELEIGEPLQGVFPLIGRQIPNEYIPTFSSMNEIRVVIGLSSHWLSDRGMKSFLDSEWKVSLESNHVAYRYSGSHIEFKPFKSPFGAGTQSPNVVDTVYPIGAIMAPNEEELILLLRDATTGGGFVTIGAAINADLDKISQSRPTTTTRFKTVTVEQAIEARLEKKKKISSLIDLLK